MNVDKGGLLFMDPRLPDTDPNRPLLQYQTNEFCFAPQGVFEIIALGEVLGQIPADVTKRQDSDDDGVDDREVFAQAKVRGILQLFETATHRTQRDFESNGYGAAQGGYGDLADRSEVVSYPVPKIYWDPKAHGLSGQSLKDFYKLWKHPSAPGNMVPSDRSGYLQLSTLRQEGTASADDTVIVEMATRRTSSSSSRTGAWSSPARGARAASTRCRPTPPTRSATTPTPVSPTRSSPGAASTAGASRT
jgi:hypothetical protein